MLQKDWDTLCIQCRIPDIVRRDKKKHLALEVIHNFTSFNILVLNLHNPTLGTLSRVDSEPSELLLNLYEFLPQTQTEADDLLVLAATELLALHDIHLQLNHILDVFQWIEGSIMEGLWLVVQWTQDCIWLEVVIRKRYTVVVKR